MKTITGFMLLVLAAAMITSCNKVNYRKTKSGLVYKIFPSNSKEPLMKVGQFVKFNVEGKINDSVLFSSYGKMPGFQKVTLPEPPPYNLLEILPMMKKGDSAITVQMIDTLIKQGAQLPPNMKKGDRVVTTLRILEVFTTDSLAMKDYNAEMEKDKPRQMKEQQEQLAKMEKTKLEQQVKDSIELEKSGEKTRELQEMEAYLKSKNISAQKTGLGTYVHIEKQGTGPLAAPGKFVNVKYTGSILPSDSAFQSNTYEFQLGKRLVILGWDEGLQLFKKGSKGTLYIPSFLAYGKNPPEGSPFKPYEALKFDIELLNISDSATAPEVPGMTRKKTEALKPKKK